MASSLSLPLTHAVSAIAASVQKEIEKSIEDAIREQVDPFIKRIAAAKALEVCERASVVMQPNVATGGMQIHVAFNGEIFQKIDVK